MKAVGLRLILQSTVLACALIATSQAHERPKHSSGGGALQAKLEYCHTCHGLSAEGYRGYYTMPRLAGQQTGYLQNQLRAFMEKRRLNTVMNNVVHGINAGMIDGLATHFHALNPAPYGGAPPENTSLGKAIFEYGIPEQNIPACSACHGFDGKGQREIPRLAGQLYWYVTKALTHWDKERGQRGQDISAIMVPTTHNLTPAQISAIAAYVSALH